MKNNSSEKSRNHTRKLIKSWTFISLVFFTCQLLTAQFYSVREQAQIKDAILSQRLDSLLPQLMDETNFDMWVLISREYNEDPVLKTMLPATWLNARRRTILVFYRDKKVNTIEKLAVARYDVGAHFKSVWNKEKQPDQWQALVDLIAARNPSRIGINVSEHFNILDGLVQTDYSAFMEKLPSTYKKRVSSSEKLAIRWIETRTEKEMKIFADLVEITHQIIAEAYSNKVIIPGQTTADDLVWWMRQKVSDLGLQTWFHPSVEIQRSDEKLKNHVDAFTNKDASKVIQPGDLLHCDFGITYLGLNTDCQEMAYVLKPGETEVPAFLQQAFKQGNAVQDALTDNFKAGSTGNEILAAALAQAKTAGLRPQIYTHPLGSYGHSSGTTIGMWDAQEGVPFTGDYPMHHNTAYAIELNAMVYVEPWGKDVRIALEESGFFGKEGFRYVNKRQTNIIAVGGKEAHLGD
jgi:Xaa-Pro aminopeptidase